MSKREPSLGHFINEKLTEMTCYGQSKHRAKIEGKLAWLEQHGSLEGWNPALVEDKIFARSTRRTYAVAGIAFAKWCKSEKNINKASQVTRQIAAEYLVYLDNALKSDGARYSPYTVSGRMTFLNKVFKFKFTKKELGLRERNQEEVIRGKNRILGERELAKNQDQIDIVIAIGCRKLSFNKLYPGDFILQNGKAMAANLKEKGGKYRIAPILPCMRARVKSILDQASPEGRLFPIIDKNIGYHIYRDEYAKKLATELQQSYTKTGKLDLDGYDCSCLVSETYKGKKNNKKKYGLDIEVAAAVSGALGHGRLDVLKSYLY